MSVGGNFTNCNCGPQAEACQSPTEPLATVGLCLVDGTPIAVTVTRDCAATVIAEGWIDLTTGVYTAGPAPDGTGSCASGCVDTVCRTLCDDADGDGQADTTYSELWCIRANGAADLVLIYQDDPSTPYTPVAPVECTYGCPDSETVILCDDNGPFLRRYTWLKGTATFEDVDLDGTTPHVVTGTPTTCDGNGNAPPECAEQTTPAATLGLCLPDGTPLAVLITRDCDGTVTQDGWLNLSSGAYTGGPPPAGAMACGDSRAFELAGLLCDVDPATGDVLGLVLVEYAYNPDGSLDSVRLVDPATGATYTLQGELRHCPSGTGDVEQPEQDLTVLCDVQADGTITAFVRDYRRDAASGQISGHTDYTLDGTPYTPTGTVGQCAEPCRDSSSTLLCDVAALDTITVLDTPNVSGADGWEVISYSNGGCPPANGPAATVPFPPYRGKQFSTTPALSIRPDQSLGASGCPVTTFNYDTAPIRWVMRKTFTAPEDGMATVAAVGFRGDGGARVRINGQDAGLYGQWNQPASNGTAQVPVTAGPNVVEVEVRDVGGPNWVGGRLDLVMTRTQQFMRRTVVDCETGETVSVTDTTLDGAPYTVTGEVGQCQPVAECCEPPAPEFRVDVETQLLCVRDQASGDVTGQVIAERVYDDQSGDLVEQRLTDLAGDPYVLPVGVELVKCPEPDRIVRTICLAKQGQATFRTNQGNAASGVDAAWEWSTSADGPWYPMYDVQPLAAWSVKDTDTASPAHWVAPHMDRTVCPATGETSPRVTGTWYTRARWTLPADVDPDTIRISASVLNADNWVDQWRLNDGAWQPVNNSRTTHASPAYTFPPTQVPGARPGDNQVVVQVHEIGPPVSCPNGNQAGMMLHVTATYQHELETWTQVIEADGRVYYLDQDGVRQDVIPDGYRQVVCGGGGEGGCCPEEPCPAHSVLSACRCDDTNGDGLADTEYVELLAVDCAGTLSSIGTYTPDLAAPYTPVAPVGCESGDEGVEPALGVQAGRVELPVGGTWDAATVAALRSVTVTAHTGTGRITTADGTTTLFQGESVTWSTEKEGDALLAGPLTITAATGIVTVTYTRGVTL
ncbi:hypothetical protein ACWEQC_22160 [Streptomyces shenzhenensis]